MSKSKPPKAAPEWASAALPDRWRDPQDLRWAARHWASRLGVALKTITLRQMRTKWASISAGGRLTLNTDLLALPADLGELVIVHELVHLLDAESWTGFGSRSCLPTSPTGKSASGGWTRSLGRSGGTRDDKRRGRGAGALHQTRLGWAVGAGVPGVGPDAAPRLRGSAPRRLRGGELGRSAPSVHGPRQDAGQGDGVRHPDQEFLRVRRANPVDHLPRRSALVVLLRADDHCPVGRDQDAARPRRLAVRRHLRPAAPPDRTERQNHQFAGLPVGPSAPSGRRATSSSASTASSPRRSPGPRTPWPRWSRPWRR